MFKDRKDAGKKLAKLLGHLQHTDTVVYALPRGGVVVGAEISRALRAPLDVIITRKIGHPDNPEYALAAIGEGGKLVGNTRELEEYDPAWFRETVEREKKEIIRRRRYFGSGCHLSPEGKTALLVDDGLATGLTMQSALLDIAQQKPKRIVVALPVGPSNTLRTLREYAEVVVLYDEKHFRGSVGAYYEHFDQVNDQEVMEILQSFRS